MFSIAELFFETTTTRFPLITRFARMLRIVVVLPVPGGPSMTEIRSDSAFSIACFCEKLERLSNRIGCSFAVSGGSAGVARR